jgi:DNA invertase Pin-like site-specific DNA recombinase
MQREAISRAATARGEPVALWLEESASAATMARPELVRLLEIARGGGLRKLYVFRLDRLSRTGIRDLLGLLDELERYGCKVETIADGFSLDGPMAQVVAAVLAFAAQMERLAIGERIAAARVRKAAKGETWGRARRMSDELAEKAVVLRVNEKRSIRSIAQALKVPRATVDRELKRRLKNLPPPTVPKGPKKAAARGSLVPPSQ